MAVKTKKSRAEVHRRREDKSARRRKRIKTGRRPRRTDVAAKRDFGASAFARFTAPLFNASRRSESQKRDASKAKHKLRKRQEKAGKVPARDNRTRSIGKRAASVFRKR